MGEACRREGEPLFGATGGQGGSLSPISILLLVRLPADQHRQDACAEILYRDIGDYKKRAEKLHTLDIEGSFFNPTWEGAPLTPNAHGDWINQRNDAFAAFLPLTPDKKFDRTAKAFFVVNSRGYETAKDPWMYSFSRTDVETNAAKIEAGYTPKAESFRHAIYRPFIREWLCADVHLTHRVGQWPQFFPAGLPKGENLVICVSGVGVIKPFSCLITDTTPDLEFVGKSQCFPLYWYSEAEQGDLFGGGLVRHDGVSDWIQREAEVKYARHVPKEELFYYVYGYLHKADWREAFAADLKKELPRIPLVERTADFAEIARIGRELADLHLHYEALDPYPLEEVGSFSNPHIEKMTFPGKDKTQVKVNDTLTLRGIPPEAHDYVVNGRSPIEWALDRYQVKRDKASGLLSDPNLWAPENPRYIPDLLKRLVTLSLRSRELMRALRADDR